MQESYVNQKAVRILQDMSNKDARQTTPGPGDGLRSLRSTSLFRAVNFELYVKPNKTVMVLGVLAMLGCSGYIFYMNSQRKNDYQTMMKSDDTIVLVRKTSKWTD